MEIVSQKVYYVTLLNVDSILNRAKHLNTVTAHKQYIQDLERAIKQLDEQASISRRRKQYLDQQIASAEMCLKEADNQINILINKEKAIVIPLQILFNSVKTQLRSAYFELVEVQERIMKFDLAIQKINVCLSQTKGRLETLLEIQKSTSIEEKVVNSLKTIDFGFTTELKSTGLTILGSKYSADKPYEYYLKQDLSSFQAGIIPKEVSLAVMAIEKRRKAIEVEK